MDLEQGVEDLKRRLRSYDARYVRLLDSAVPLLESGRVIDLEHTLDVLRVLLDQLDEHPELAARHNVLIPAALLHDVGWSEVPEDERSTSYGDVRPDNDGKVLHQQKGAAIARTLLGYMEWTPNAIESVVFIVSRHDVPEEYAKDRDALLIAEIDKLVRYMPYLFWALVNDGTMALGRRIRFLERGVKEWFVTPEFAQRARCLLEERKREASHHDLNTPRLET